LSDTTSTFYCLPQLRCDQFTLPLHAHDNGVSQYDAINRLSS